MPISTPKTIEELKQWYEEHELPPQDITRFFIGVNYQQPRAFGIYQDGDRYIVYKNKNDGSRAIRYQGPDEAYAVKELWEKLKEEILRQKANQPGRSSASGSTLASGTSSNKGCGSIVMAFAVIMAFFTILAVTLGGNIPDRGYYKYTGHPGLYQDYYYLSGNWYYYDNLSAKKTWKKTSNPPADLKENWKDYYQGNSYSRSYDVSDFTTTTYYADYQEQQSSHDSYSWDSSDSWDSGGMDFDSDW